VIRLVNNYRHDQVALTLSITADPTHVMCAHGHALLERQPYNISAKTEATLVTSEEGGQRARLHQQETYRIFNVLLLRWRRVIFLRFGTHQEIVRGIIIGQYCA
jgi:hypothetical protein